MIENIITLSYTAGLAIKEIYNGKQLLNLSNKIDNSPVTSADLISHQILTQGLQTLTPNLPILSEESITTWSIRRNWFSYWLIDPLDGTKEFLQHNDEFTVNIALIKHGQPIIGVIHVPVTNVTYAALNNQAWKVNQQGKFIDIKAKNISPPLVIISRLHNNNNKLVNYLNKLNKYQIMSMGSSLKFCMIAEGIAQLYPRFGLTNIWDTAAGHAIATASGAKVTNFSGKSLDYNPRESLFNPDFQVSSL